MIATGVVMRLQVPLANMSSGVARRLQSFGECRVFGRHIADNLRRYQLMIRPLRAAGATVIRQTNPARILTGLNARPCRRADRIGRIGITKEDTLSSQCINMRRFVKGAAGYSQIRPA